eukprot:3711287-Rhodomonas_salina.1
MEELHSAPITHTLRRPAVGAQNTFRPESKMASAVRIAGPEDPWQEDGNGGEGGQVRGQTGREGGRPECTDPKCGALREMRRLRDQINAYVADVEGSRSAAEQNSNRGSTSGSHGEGRLGQGPDVYVRVQTGSASSVLPPPLKSNGVAVLDGAGQHDELEATIGGNGHLPTAKRQAGDSGSNLGLSLTVELRVEAMGVGESGWHIPGTDSEMMRSGVWGPGFNGGGSKLALAKIAEEYHDHDPERDAQTGASAPAGNDQSHLHHHDDHDHNGFDANQLEHAHPAQHAPESKVASGAELGPSP